MGLTKALYIELNLVSVAILMIMLLCIMGIYYDFDKAAKTIFVKLSICNIIALLSDIGIYLINGCKSDTMIIGNHIVCMIYFTMHPLFGYYWLRFTLQKLRYDKPTKTQTLVILLPVIISIIAIVTSPMTKHIYYLTDNNVYMRGKYMSIIIITSFAYCIIGIILVIKETVKKLMVREKAEFLTMLLFPIPTIVGCIAQMRYYGITAIWVLSAISLFISFISLQNYQITRDFLTGLYNRMQTEKLINKEILLLPKADYISFVCMIDIDNFKSINDRFGHTFGDKALIDAAKIIRTGCRKRDSVGRFGGDEFIVLGRARSEKEVKDMIAGIERQADIYNSASPIYPIHFSHGYKLYNKDDCPTIDSVIHEADLRMYENKNRNKEIRKMELNKS